MCPRCQKTTSQELVLTLHFLEAERLLLSVSRCVLQVRWATNAQAAVGLCSPSPCRSAGIADAHHNIWLFMWILGIKFQLSGFQSKHFHRQSLLDSLKL